MALLLFASAVFHHNRRYATNWIGAIADEGIISMKLLSIATLIATSLWLHAANLSLAPVVEVEEEVYSYTNANNGAGPMWCSGSTCLARVGERVFASGLETITDAKPLNNCRWVLFMRGDGKGGWSRVAVDEVGRTREPAPLAAFPDGRVFLSVNPTLGSGPEPNGGPARPDVLQFSAADPTTPPAALTPLWNGATSFAEHSYRSFAADGEAGELILFQNVGYTHSEWTFRDATGKWSAQGKLKWPWGAEYDKPEPIRVCYPNVALHGRGVHFFGVSDVQEPYKKWREFKHQLTGQEWDYDFRRLFYTWTPDVTREPFAEWIEISSRDKTAGWISPGDLWLAPNGDAHLLWMERAIDERLREKFFPDAKQTNSLKYAVVHEGKVIRRQTLMETREGTPGIVGSAGRFCVTPDDRLFVLYLATGSGSDGKRIFENRILELHQDGTMGPTVRISFQNPFTSYFTATPR
ncbi:MAG: hypothetical protein JWM99_294, partial [Verrucomicrobiales bacterium]|nr:hypothetical protein [Verrucomicrobiales bacterium]